MLALSLRRKSVPYTTSSNGANFPSGVLASQVTKSSDFARYALDSSVSTPGGALRYTGGPHLSYVFRGRRGLF